jgi:hypothetical protein
MTKIELNENHRRAISITLQLVDQALCEWTEWAEGKVRSGVMYRQSDTLSEIQKRELQSKIKLFRKAMTRLHDDLELEEKNIRTAHSIVTHASLLWEMLTELNSRGLQAYGTVPEKLGRYLDPIGEQLTDQMSAIGALLSQSRQSVDQD